MLLAGKSGLVISVGNDRSLGWGIADLCADNGAKVAIGVHTNRTFEERVKLPRYERFEWCVADLNDQGQVEAITNVVKRLNPDSQLDFIVHSVAFGNREELGKEGGTVRRFIDMSEEGYEIAMKSTAYSFVRLVKAFEPFLTLGASIVTISYIGATRAARGYNIGPAKAALES